MFGYDTVPTTEFIPPPVIVRSVACGPSRPVLSASVPCQRPTYAPGTTAPAGPAEDVPTAVGLAAAEPAIADGFLAGGAPGEPECSTVTAITAAAAAAAATAEPAMTAVCRRGAGRAVTRVAG